MVGGATFLESVPTQGNLNWKELNGSKDLPDTSAGPRSQNKIKVRVKRGEGNKIKVTNKKVDQREYTRVMKAAVQDIENRYYNPDPLFRLIGESNEANV